MKSENKIPQCPVIDFSLPPTKCSPVVNVFKYEKVLFDPETKNVFDQHGNYIGKGEYKDGVVNITLDRKV